ncbi:hypothetical protein V5O48_010877 [Marasmius crinis-equi]|uniref:Uncharacterized protein n=1 Tax=Marasmius crinis-equi TaxID=585013 RepID=A0ABR3F7G3_9AGAR
MPDLGTVHFLKLLHIPRPSILMPPTPALTSPLELHIQTTTPAGIQTSYRLPAASSLSFLSYQNTSEALQEWKATNTPLLKRKERGMCYPDVFLQGNTKRARLLETSESDTIQHLCPAHEVECGASLSHLGGGVQRMQQPYGLSESMGGPVTQTSKPEDEIRWLREEIERLRGILKISGSKSVA